MCLFICSSVSCHQLAQVLTPAKFMLYTHCKNAMQSGNQADGCHKKKTDYETSVYFTWMKKTRIMSQKPDNDFISVHWPYFFLLLHFPSQALHLLPNRYPFLCGWEQHRSGDLLYMLQVMYDLLYTSHVTSMTNSSMYDIKICAFTAT